jgi:FAD/FMN-containing dehydrogenase
MKPESNRQTLFPVNESELSALLKGNSRMVKIIGSGSNQIDSHYSDDFMVISTSRLNQEIIVSISNQTVTVSAGVSVKLVKERLKQDNLSVAALTRFDSGTIGGRLASVSSRPRPNEANGWIQSLLGITVVLPNGDIVSAGGECIKDVAGYDLRHLFTGCRGATGVIVRAIFRCSPLEILSTNQVFPNNINSIDSIVSRQFDPTDRMRLIE